MFMEKYEYDDFSTWLKNVKKHEQTNELEYIYMMNHLLFRWVCNKNLFDIIREKQYYLLVKMRSHWSYLKNKRTLQERENVLSLVFEYLGRNYEEFLEYEDDDIPTSIKEKLWNSRTLYIHAGRIKCIRFHHDIQDIAALIPIDNQENIKVHASYCTKCKITFITKSFYLQLRKRYPIMIANFCELDSNGNPLNKIEGKTESILKLCGYSVKMDGPSTTTRHFILRSILEREILSKTDIITYLEFFLSYNASKDGMFQAERKWQSDLNYVRNLDIDTHPEMKISGIKSYSSVH